MPDLERLGQYLEEMKTKMVQDLTEILRNHEDLANQAQWVQWTHEISTSTSTSTHKIKV